MSSVRSYWSFISYSHRDEAFARWLHRRLETWRPPPELIGKPSPLGLVPRSLSPVFRDRDDFSGGSSLQEATLEALRSARSLVVICSPSAASSRYVGEEIRQFRALAPGAPIIPVIIDGVPGDSERDCFPSALRHPDSPDQAPREPIAADAREEGDGQERAFAKVVAGLLGVPSDAIIKREQQAQRRRRAYAGGAIAGAALFATAFASYALYQTYEAQQTIEKSVSAIGGLIVRTEQMPRDEGGSDLRTSMLREECDLMDGLSGESDVAAPLESAICFYERTAQSADRRPPGETLRMMCARRNAAWVVTGSKPKLSWDEAALLTYVSRRTLQGILTDAAAAPADCGVPEGAKAVDHMIHALGLLDRVGRLRPDLPDARIDHDAILWDATMAAEAAGNWNQSIAIMQEGAALRAVQMESGSADGMHPAAFDRGVLLRRTSWVQLVHLSDAMAALASAEAALEIWRNAPLDDPAIVYQVALGQVQFADAAMGAGRSDDAMQAYREARTLAAGLAAREDADAAIRDEAGSMVSYIDGVLSQTQGANP